MDRRKFLGTTAAAGAALIAKPYIAHAAKHQLLVAEPVHSTGYLPMYIAMAKNYFAEADIEVKIVTIETGGGHTNAVLSGQAFAFIGGPEHNAYAKAKGAELRAVVHCVDRGNIYFCAAKGNEPKNTDWPAYFKGQTHRGRPLRRHAERHHALSAQEVESRCQERRDAATRCRTRRCRPRVRGGQAKIGVITEPMIAQGIKHRPVGRAVLQRAERTRPLRLLDHQHPAGIHQEAAGSGARLRARHDEGSEIPLRRQGRRGRRSPRSSSRPWRWKISRPRSTARSPTRCGARTA